MSNVNVIEKTIAGVPTDYYYEDTAGRDMIAAEQDLSLVAIKDYAVGDLFWYNNLLYKAKAPIEENATITLATDAEQTTVSAELATKQDTLTFDTIPTANSNNPVTSGGTKSAIDASASASLQILEDTVGWTGKNKLPLYLKDLKSRNTQGTWNENVYTRNSVTFTVATNSDDVVTGITINTSSASAETIFYLGTAGLPIPLDAGTYIFTGCPEGGSSSTYRLRIGGVGADTGSGFTFTQSQDGVITPEIVVANNATVSNVVFKPMVRLSTVSDDTFEPYHDTVKDSMFPRKEAEKYGVKNILPYPYYDKGNKTTRSINFIDNGDGSITVEAGTATGGHAQYYLFGNGNSAVGDVSDLVGKKISSGISNDNVIVRVWYYNSSKTYISAQDATKDGRTLVIPSNAVYYTILIRIDQNVTISSDTVVYPMLSDVGGTWQPYAKTNKQLTDDVTTVTDECTNLVSGSTASYNVVSKCANTVCLDLKMSAITATAYSTVIGNVPSGFRPKTDTFVPIYSGVDGTFVKVLQNGDIQLSNDFSSKSATIHAVWVI